ncbi:hypothetical protein [Arthrobacter sp. MA-N2]|uniref:hypothetical protein n=1 Tax=Arthrobacter sp. MA-N2 TaxID=1101188 RepID=UPI0004B331D3|nr:hypothetical protein [Arthrobacter sp. MA-N2]
MKVAVKPRSDQWNADDFTGGPRTFTIAGVKHGTAEALYDIELVEGEGRAWRPPNGMLSVLIQLWGDEASEWAGRRVTLFKDPSVRVGKDVPGGIRISHMSDIGPKGASPSITVSRGQRRPYPVKPLAEALAVPAPQQPDLTIPDSVKANTAKAIAEGKVPSYLAWLGENNAPQHFIDYVNAQTKESE